MKAMNLFAAATLALGLFACDRNADRASETHTTSASQPVERSGTTTPAPLAPADTSTSLSGDGGHAGVTTTTSASDLDMNAKDGGHISITPSGKSDSDLNMNAKDGGHRAGPTNVNRKGGTTAPKP